MTLVWVLVLTALLVSDVAGQNNSSEVHEALRAIIEPVRGRCEDGWYEYKATRSCYRFFNIRMTWKAAQAHCNTQDHYGELASVISCDHNTFVTRVTQKVTGPNPYAWIGLRDFCQRGTYAWIDDRQFNYENWGYRKPVDHTKKYFCVLTNFGGQGVWSNYPCTSKFGFICAYKLH